MHELGFDIVISVVTGLCVVCHTLIGYSAFQCHSRLVRLSSVSRRVNKMENNFKKISYILKETNSDRISHEDRIQLKKLCRKLKLIDKNMTLVGIKNFSCEVSSSIIHNVTYSECH